MSIINIKSTTLRRAVLVATLVPLVLLNAGWFVWDGGLRELRRLPDAVRAAWRGR